MHLLRLWMLGMPKAKAGGYSRNSFAKISEKSWSGKDYLFLLQNRKDVNFGYFITKWPTAMCREKENVYKRAQGTDHHQPHSSVKWTWCYFILVALTWNRRAFGLHSSSNFPSIPISLYFLSLNKKQKV